MCPPFLPFEKKGRSEKRKEDKPAPPFPSRGKEWKGGERAGPPLFLPFEDKGRRKKTREDKSPLLLFEEKGRRERRRKERTRK